MKKYLMFLVKLLIAHGLSMALYGILFSSAAAQAADHDDLAVANSFLAVFGAASFLVFNLVLAIQFYKNGTVRREFQTGIKGRTLAPADYVRIPLRELSICTAIWAVFQLPYCIFYASFGFDHVNAIFVDKLFVMPAGVYTLCGGSSVLGLVVSTLLFCVIQLAARGMILRHWDESRFLR